MVGAVTLPIARRLIFPAADRYASSSAGDIPNVPAMLSNPWVESSDGRNFVASTSSASRSRIAFAYSVRLRRCRPGGGRCGVAWRSSSLSSQPIRLSRVAGSGRGIPDGGIIPARSFRTTFSPTCAWSPRCARSSLSSSKFAVLSFSLWQVTQYRSRSARGAATSGAGEASAFAACRCGTPARGAELAAGRCGSAAWPDTRATDATTKPPATTILLYTDPSDEAPLQYPRGFGPISLRLCENRR